MPRALLTYGLLVTGLAGILLSLLGGCSSETHLLANPSPDLGSVAESALTFAVFGDGRPPKVNDTADYPSTILGGIFTQAQAKGAQFMVGTGDYVYASEATAVGDQGNLLLAAEANFQGPIYHTLGNHECTGATNSNCPDGNETPNVQFFMSHLVPSGTTTPWYRVDVETPSGKAKFLMVAENAWTAAQNDWLQQQLADATPYTFVVRHEPDGANAPGLAPSDTLLAAGGYTLLLEGHYHEYSHKAGSNEVISGNAGAPLSSSTLSYGFLLIELGADGNVSVSEIEEASGNVLDSWKVSPSGQTL